MSNVRDGETVNRHFFVIGLLATVGACSTDQPADESRDAGAVSDAAMVGDSGGLDAGRQDTSAPRDSGDTADMRAAPSDMAGTIDMRPDLGEADAAVPDMGEADLGAPVEPGERCAVAPDVTAGGTFTGDTTGAADDYSSNATNDGCPSGSASGGDHVFLLAPAVETIYTIAVTPTGNFDPFLYVKSDCALSSCIDGTVLNGPGTPEMLGLTVPAGETYYVIVDGELLSEGGYTLEITTP